MSSDRNQYRDEWQKYKDQLVKLETTGEADSKSSQKIRGTMIQLWNKLTPDQQRELARKYIPE